MKKQIISAYFPFTNDVNKYTENVENCIREAGIKIVNLRRYMFPLKDFFACKIYNFNWIEDRLVDNAQSGFKQWLKYVRMCITFDLIKLKGGKIIWTMHNKLPHGKANRKYKVKLMKKIARRASVVVIHCADSVKPLKELYPHIKDDKIRFINHPSYIGSYPAANADIRGRLSISEEDKVFLFVGSVRRYKNIETLITAFKGTEHNGIKLVIAGKPESDEYAASLLFLAGEDKDIIFESRFIPDEEISGYLSAADISVLPYDIENVLNSGSVYMSFSYKTTVICPAIGTINQLKDKSFVYAYSYSCDAEHAEKLKAALEKAISDIRKNPDVLAECGQRAYEYMLKEHSSKSIAEAYGALYGELAGEK